MPGAPLIVTVTLWNAEPPVPVHVRMKVAAAVYTAVVCVPEVALLLLHAPEAVQLAALLDDQLSVDMAPLVTVDGLALSDTVGAGAVVPTVTVVST